VLPAAAAFATIHCSWSAGFSSFFLTGASATSRRQPGGRRPRAGLTGVQLVVALTTIALVGIVGPWSMVSRVHAGRIARASAEVRTIAASLRVGISRLGPFESDTVLVGPGADPELPPNSDWRNVLIIRASATHSELQLGPDPWGNRYSIYFAHDH